MGLALLLTVYICLRGHSHRLEQVRKILKNSRRPGQILVCDIAGGFGPICHWNKFPTITATRGKALKAYYVPSLLRFVDLEELGRAQGHLDRKCIRFSVVCANEIMTASCNFTVHLRRTRLFDQASEGGWLCPIDNRTRARQRHDHRRG